MEACSSIAGEKRRRPNSQLVLLRLTQLCRLIPQRVWSVAQPSRRWSQPMFSLLRTLNCQSLTVTPCRDTGHTIRENGLKCGLSVIRSIEPQANLRESYSYAHQPTRFFSSGYSPSMHCSLSSLRQDATRDKTRLLVVLHKLHAGVI